MLQSFEVEIDEPEKTTGPSGVIPIAVLKEESDVVDTTTLYLAFIIRNLIFNYFGCNIQNILDIYFQLKNIIYNNKLKIV